MVLSLPGGAIADRLSKKRIVQTGQVANTLVSAVIATLMLTDLLVFEHLLACAVIQGSINSLLMPARQSMISEIVDDARLMNAVALNTAAMNTMRLIAPAIGGLILAVVGGGWAYVLMACLYFSGALLLFPVRLTRNAGRSPVATVGRSGWLQGFADIAEGCRYMWRDRTVFLLLSINLIIVLFSMPYQMMLPGFAKDVLGAGPERLGLLMTITGAGSLMGSLTIASLPARNRGLILLVGSLVMGIFLILFSISTWYWATAAIMLGVGIGQATRMSLGNVLLQSYTDPDYRGRVMSIYMMEFSLVSLGTFIIGVLSNVMGVQVALGATSVTLVVLVIAVLIFGPRMRRLQ
jgi:MFS family permease